MNAEMKHLQKIRDFIQNSNSDNTTIKNIAQYIDDILPSGTIEKIAVCSACMTDPFGDCGCGGKNTNLYIQIDKRKSIIKTKIL